MPDIAAAVATEEPETAEKPAQAAMVAAAKPPGSLRSHLSKALYRSSIRPLTLAKLPIIKKRGITIYE